MEKLNFLQPLTSFRNYSNMQICLLENNVVLLMLKILSPA